MNNTLQ